ncbi:uncharacterized protein LOC142357520 [Convolutriloba macropyga]|uniref:uncharacterized protein LOC142357520 n=1 Tax=Convolutriloba macropyga TaxID=536237 RepID=UPI003F524DE3
MSTSVCAGEWIQHDEFVQKWQPVEDSQKRTPHIQITSNGGCNCMLQLDVNEVTAQLNQHILKEEDIATSLVQLQAALDSMPNGCLLRNSLALISATLAQIREMLGDAMITFDAAHERTGQTRNVFHLTDFLASFHHYPDDPEEKLQAAINFSISFADAKRGSLAGRIVGAGDWDAEFLEQDQNFFQNVANTLDLFRDHLNRVHLTRINRPRLNLIA